MLASLLAKTPVIPSHSLSTSIASPKPSALPQEKLPKDLKVSQWRRHFFFLYFRATAFGALFLPSSFSFFSLPLFYARSAITHTHTIARHSR
jgi:hypothetical protein